MSERGEKMRTYVKPDMRIINLRVEERISGSCIVVGSCPGEKGELMVTNNV
jgi:hypothetical protein